MRVLGFLLYLFIILLGSGGNFQSELHQISTHSASHQRMDKHFLAEYFNNAVAFNLVEDVFPDLIDDNTSAGNEDDNDDNCNSFSQKNSIPHWAPIDLADLFILKHTLISSRLPGDKDSPIYLRNRVLRI